VLIWTTTPWTIPSNLAVAFHPEFRLMPRTRSRLASSSWPRRWPRKCPAPLGGPFRAPVAA
jgi:hypothetical protein